MHIDNLQTGNVLGSATKPEYAFNHLRSGLDFLLKQSRLSKIKSVLVPAFICPIVPEVFRRNGVEVRKVDADLETFNMKIEEKADAALICHTFGSRMKLPEGMTVIEDCAHDITKPFEGDFGLYSLSKQLPNVRGGYIETSEDLPYSHLGQDRLGFFEVLMKSSGPHRKLLNFLRSKNVCRNVGLLQKRIGRS